MRTISQYNLQRNILKSINKIFSFTDHLGDVRIINSINPSAQLHITSDNIESGYVYTPYLFDTRTVYIDSIIHTTTEVNPNYYSVITI